ncbi:MAG: hypothetical protein AAF468_21865 [Pseudomonadota bacterium]
MSAPAEQYSPVPARGEFPAKGFLETNWHEVLSPAQKKALGHLKKTNAYRKGRGWRFQNRGLITFRTAAVLKDLYLVREMTKKTPHSLRTFSRQELTLTSRGRTVADIIGVRTYG